MTDWNLVISASSLALVILTSAITIVRRLSRSEISMRSEAQEKFAALQLEAALKIAAVEVASAKKIAEVQAEAAQKIAAVSDKVYQVEIWARDEFVRKGSFEIVVARMERGMSELRTEITGRLDKVADLLHGNNKP